MPPQRALAKAQPIEYLIQPSRPPRPGPGKNLLSELNDARVMLAGRRLLAWNKVSVGCVALGFLIERCGWLAGLQQGAGSASANLVSVVGMAIIGLGVAAALWSYLQHERTVKSLRPVVLASSPMVRAGQLINVLVGLLGSTLAITLYLDALAGI